MHCLPFLGRPASISPLSRHIEDLPAALLAEVLRAVPINVEISLATGAVFSNRPFLVAAPPLAFSVRLAGGASLRLWGEGAQCGPERYVIVTSPTPAKWVGLETESEGAVLSVAPQTTCCSEPGAGACALPSALRALRDADLPPGTLEALPVQAFVAAVANGEVTRIRWVVYAEGGSGCSRRPRHSRPPYCHRVNARWATFRGLSPGDLPVDALRSNIHPDDAESTAANWKRAIASGTDYSNLCRMRRASDGAYVWFRGDACPLRDVSGTVVAYAGVA